MKRAIRMRLSARLVLSLLLLACPLLAHPIAVIEFPGLDSLTSSSDAIVVLQVAPKHRMSDITGYPEDMEVTIESVIKLDPRQLLQQGTTTTVALKGGDYTSDTINKLVEREVPECLRSSDADAAPGERYLVFLEKTTHWQFRAAYTAINCSGAMLHLPKTYHPKPNPTTDPPSQVRQVITEAAKACKQ